MQWVFLNSVLCFFFEFSLLILNLKKKYFIIEIEFSSDLHTLFKCLQYSIRQNIPLGQQKPIEQLQIFAGEKFISNKYDQFERCGWKNYFFLQLFYYKYGFLLF